MSRVKNFFIGHFVLAMACIGLAGCNEYQEPVFTDKTTSTNIQPAPHRDPTGQLIVKPLEYGDSTTQVNLVATKIPEQFDTVKWQPLQASNAFIVEPNALETAVILPVVNEQTVLLFELQLTQGSKTYRAVTQIVVLPLANYERFGGVISQSPEGDWLIPVVLDAANSLFTVTAFISENSQEELAIFDVAAQENILSISPSLLASCCDNLRIVKVHIAHDGEPLMTAWLLKSNGESSSLGSSIFSLSSSLSSLTLSSISAFSSSSISSASAASSSATQIPSSSQSSAISSSAELQFSSAIANSSLGSVDFSSASTLMASSSSGPSEREFAVAAICADSWQGLASLPVAHANYQTQSPYFNHEPFIDPVFVQHIEQSQTREAGNSALVAAMEMLKTQPTGVWLDNAAGLCESVNGKPSLVEYLNLAEARSQLLTLVLYDIPARDCVRQERPGEFEATEFGLADYQHFVDRVSALAAVYSNVPIAMVVEPTAFATTVSNGGVARTNCFEARQLQLHEQALAFALKRLAGNANVFSYLDYGDPSWPGSFSGDQALVDLLERTKLSDGSLAVEGISLNVGSYVPLAEPFMLAQNNAGEPFTLPKGVQSINAHRDYLNSILMEKLGVALPILIDTGRNGWGGELRPRILSVGQESRVDRRVGREAWCNVLSAGLGEGYLGGTNTSFFWVDAPGISDGNIRSDCNASFNKVVHNPKLGAPEAGLWFHEYFIDLIRNAYPPLVTETEEAVSQPMTMAVKASQIPVQAASDVEMIITLPRNVTFTSLSLRFAGANVMPSESWLGQNQFSFSLDNIPLTYFHDVLTIAARGSDGLSYTQQAAIFDSPEFDGKPISDIALGGQGFFPDFYRIFQAELPEYTYSNRGNEGNDFLWVSNFGTIAADGGEGDDFVQSHTASGGNGDDILAVWSYASGGDGNDTFYVWDSDVVVEDTPKDFDVVFWLGRNFTEVNPQDTYTFVANGEDLIATERRNNADDGVLTVKGFFADPPHINEIHYGDGQILTPETAREMLGLNTQ